MSDQLRNVQGAGCRLHGLPVGDSWIEPVVPAIGGEYQGHAVVERAQMRLHQLRNDGERGRSFLGGWLIHAGA